MRICYFGIYDQDYARHRVLREGLRANGVEVVECRIDPRQNRGIKKYVALTRAYFALENKKFDFVLVAFPGHRLVPIAKILFSAPVVFDAFLSVYDSNVYDRGAYSSRSIRAWRDWVEDYMSMHSADAVLLDTNEHINYCANTFHIKKEKFVRVLIGADDGLFHPRKRSIPQGPHIVHFHGTFIPLQGISYIIEAARLLKDEPIKFKIVGNGQEYAFIAQTIEQEGLHNVILLGLLPYEEIPLCIASAEVCLGIFGDTPKTDRVIPNKVYECLAMGKPVITADTPAVQELNEFGRSPLLLVPAANPHALAEAIKKLLSEEKQIATLGEEGAAFFAQNFRPERIVRDMLTSLKPLLSKQ